MKEVVVVDDDANEMFFPGKMCGYKRSFELSKKS